MSDTKSLIGQVNKISSRVWDVYRKPDVRVDVEDYTYVFNAVEGREDLSTQDDFEISNQDLGVYINPSDSWLEFRVKIGDAAKATDAAPINANVAIQNDFMNAFSRAELELDDLKVEEVKEPGLVINALGLMNQSPDHEEIGSLWGWAKDGIITEIENKITQFGDTNAGGYGAFPTNKGFLRRARELFNGRQKTFWYPLRRLFPFFNNNRMVFKGQNIKITLTKNPSSQIFHTEFDTAQTPVFLNYFRVGIHWATIKPDPSTSLILERKLASNQKQSLLWNAITLNKTKDFVTEGDLEYDFVVQKGVPQRLIILPYLTTQFTDPKKATTQWPNITINTLQVKLNSKNYPQKQLKVRFAPIGSINTGEAYHFFADAGGMIFDRGGGNLISEREWSERYRIYVIEFPKAESVFDPKRNWEIQVEINLTVPGGNTAFRFFNIVQSTRKATLQGLQGKLNFEN